MTDIKESFKKSFIFELLLCNSYLSTTCTTLLAFIHSFLALNSRNRFEFQLKVGNIYGQTGPLAHYNLIFIPWNETEKLEFSIIIQY